MVSLIETEDYKKTRMKPLPSETTHELTEGLVSVVMPAFNVEAFLRRAVNSVLNQTFQRLKLLIIDDGSTDNTAKVAREFGDKVHYIYQKNAGASAARNHGIKEALGEFIAFLDGDDEWLPHHIEGAMEVFNRYPFLKWYGSFPEERSYEIEVLKKDIRQKIRGLLGAKGYFDDYFQANAIGKVFWTGTFVIRKSVFAEVGMFNCDLQTGEDLDMWLRIALRYPEIGYSLQTGAIYWRRHGSLTTKYSIDLWENLTLLERNMCIVTGFSLKVVDRYSPLFRLNLRGLYIDGIKTGNRYFLRHISSKYNSIIPYRWRIVNFVHQIIPFKLWIILYKSMKTLKIILRNLIKNTASQSKNERRYDSNIN